MNALVFGQSGQVARELAHLAPEARFLSRTEADLTDPAACRAAILAARPQVVINAAAWTAVDRAEAEQDAAFVVNADAPAVMAEACAALQIPFLHVSTDYAFAGTGQAPWRPDDTPAPQNIYGASKLAGERAVMASGAQALVLRTSWVFSAHGANFLKTMLRLGAEREALSIVADQIGGPTPARAIAAALLTAAAQMQADPSKGGLHHFSGAPDVSWAGFAREIFAQAGLSVAVTEIATENYPTPAKRPLNSRLDCSALEAEFGITRPDWRAAVRDCLDDLGRPV